MFALPIVGRQWNAPSSRSRSTLPPLDGAELTVRSSLDLIAACAIRHSLTVLHTDRDYTSLSRISPLRTQVFALR
jgi:hypothetical protein